MPIIKGIKDGTTSMNVIPASERFSTIYELQQKDFKQIHDDETGEMYPVLFKCDDCGIIDEKIYSIEVTTGQLICSACETKRTINGL